MAEMMLTVITNIYYTSDGFEVRMLMPFLMRKIRDLLNFFCLDSTRLPLYSVNKIRIAPHITYTMHCITNYPSKVINSNLFILHKRPPPIKHTFFLSFYIEHFSEWGEGVLF